MEKEIRFVITRGRGGGELDEGGQKGQTSGYEINESWGYDAKTFLLGKNRWCCLRIVKDPEIPWSFFFYHSH